MRSRLLALLVSTFVLTATATSAWAKGDCRKCDGGCSNRKGDTIPMAAAACRAGGGTGVADCYFEFRDNRNRWNTCFEWGCYKPEKVDFDFATGIVAFTCKRKKGQSIDRQKVSDKFFAQTNLYGASYLLDDGKPKLEDQNAGKKQPKWGDDDDQPASDAGNAGNS